MASPPPRPIIPHAILLDIKLPDNSGLGLLDQLKRNTETRHIPVHVISASDYTHQALERGAIGYATKPVNRDQLVAALERLAAKLSQGPRHVLVVEDDDRQRESIRQLLEGDDVRITGASSAAEALDHLKTTTFDCIVMDLKLPDLSGYELLEKMASQEDISLPPVIVYTGARSHVTRNRNWGATRGRSSSRTRGRRNVSSTRSPCSCIRSRRSCRPIVSAC